jgi:hypothetical protein
MSARIPDHRQKLLSDVVEDGMLREFHARLKSQALGEFRRARFLRRVGSLAALAAVLVAAGAAGVYNFRAPRVAPRTIAKAQVQPESAVTQSNTEPPARLHTLTDEELIASFPPNTCYLAEVDGRKMLVFQDPELRKQFLH